MDSRTQKRVEQWDSRPFSDGYSDLSTLADDGFSGAVSGGGTWLFMLNGRIVGVFEGTIEDFEDASGTAYQAPHPSLPLLCSMEERGGETRAKYYTNETPLAEVDETLQDGSFTGYIELSENVLSGDYYAVYYGGRRMAAAYIGNAERLITGDEAFERANDEVGIYEVTTVDLEVVDVPETADGSEPTDEPESTDEPATGTAASDSPSPSGIETSNQVNSPSNGESESTTESTTESIEPIDVSGSDPTESDEDTSIDGIMADETSLLAGDEDRSDDGSAGITSPDSNEDSSPSETITEQAPSTIEYDSAQDEGGAGEEIESPATDEPTQSQSIERDPDGETAADDQSSLDPDEVEAAAEELEQNEISWTDGEPDADSSVTAPAPDTTSETDETVDADDDADADDEPVEERFEEEQQWRSTRSIPSIDPDNTEASELSAERPTSDSGTASVATDRGSSKPNRSASKSSDSRRRSNEGAAQSNRANGGAARQSSRSAGRSAATASTSAQSDRSEQLTQRLSALEDRRDELEAKAAELESERDRLRSENQELSATVERLQSRIDELETELKRARNRDEKSDRQTPSRQLSAQQALSGTNLFVRYGSKSQPTLETAHDGDADRSDVASNLGLEHHTEFDDSDVAVDDTPYAEFLSSAMEYQFVEWLTTTLLFEIRDTGHASGLADLYDAIPRIDRAELHASISLEDDDTETVPDEIEFDVVAYDKMGQPLIVVNVNDSRQPATQDMLEEMEESASAVKANYPELASAIVVTSSYFEPGALEVTEQATSSGILSRGSKQSFVNLSRKQGYHLCLVETQSEGFHMNVPEL
ncbi:transcriptional regulator [Natrialbaceae archaeon A-arb3/5]